ncbi:hypothetical protein [Pseudoruegeria sp. HB172150]|uniref:hypothetical protein n=1 Tax=Pseudoruegeria sp. HB172150 TaxID=2721164 RepID=UPI0015516A95|nr:hypothetical protein [Pseudoruegeria sp. HB172150]
MPRLAVVLSMLLASPATAQGWETFDHDLGAGAAVCPYDDADTGEFFCFAFACLPGAEGQLMFRVAIQGPEIAQEAPPLSVHVDGKTVGMMFMPLLEHTEMYDFGKPYDPARDASLLAALRAGSRAMLIFGIGPDAKIYPVSLSGSQAAIDKVPELCGAAPLDLPEPD